ncbi:MAG: hypothetical protein JXQ75_04270 [Phycisphaerae bacterium]|nr:hypothetical protein [Phycisphaerae bacterium]
MRTLISEMRLLALAALKRMYRPNEGVFAFRLRRRSDGDDLEGSSIRYTAMALIGLAGETEDTSADVLGGRTTQQVCAPLLAAVTGIGNLGDVAVILWAARALGHADVSRALTRLRALDPCAGRHATVELAWALAALTATGDASPDEKLARHVAQRLLKSYRQHAGMFPHWPNGAKPSSLRSHVACFADLVYPTQALSYYGAAMEDSEALGVARACAERMCAAQGPEGQWWWHYDARTGRVLERYPVYAVHQDAMAPMALFAVQEACGADYSAAIERGLNWLVEPPEIDGSLIDTEARLIWRKVGRREPGKLSRSLQAIASGVHSALRVPGLDWVFRPGRIDFESRPYHMGWLLYAWSGERVSRLPTKPTGGRQC